MKVIRALELSRMCLILTVVGSGFLACHVLQQAGNNIDQQFHRETKDTLGGSADVGWFRRLQDLESTTQALPDETGASMTSAMPAPYETGASMTSAMAAPNETDASMASAMAALLEFAGGGDIADVEAGNWTSANNWSLSAITSLDASMTSTMPAPNEADASMLRLAAAPNETDASMMGAMAALLEFAEGGDKADVKGGSWNSANNWSFSAIASLDASMASAMPAPNETDASMARLVASPNETDASMASAMAALLEFIEGGDKADVDADSWTSANNWSLSEIASFISNYTNISELDALSAVTELAEVNKDPIPFREVGEWIWQARRDGLVGLWIPTPGDMIMRKGGGCQAHYLIGEELEWVSGSAGLDTSVSAEILVKHPVTTDAVCPCDAGDNPTCSFNPVDWNLRFKNPTLFRSSYTLYGATMYLMFVFFVLKVISLDGYIVDSSVAWLCRVLSCGKWRPDTSGRMKEIMLSFEFLDSKASAMSQGTENEGSLRPSSFPWNQSLTWTRMHLKYPMLQALAKEAAKLLRLNVASKVLIMPLTTLGFNAKCPKHVYTKIIDPWLWYILISATVLDAFLIVLYYVLMSCFPNLKARRILYLPFGLPLLGALAGVIAGFMYYDVFMAVFGVNISLALRFNMSPEIHCFQISLLILTLIEYLDTTIRIASMARAVEKSPSNMAAPAGKAAVDLKVESQTQDSAGASRIKMEELNCPGLAKVPTAPIEVGTKHPEVEALDLREEPQSQIATGKNVDLETGRVTYLL